MPIKVLIIDDSAVVRNTLQQELSRDNQIEVVGTAADPIIAKRKIAELKPQVLTLDIEMPRMDGITFLKELMSNSPMPVIIVSSLTKEGSEISLEALNLGAVEVMCKPGASYKVGDMSLELRHKIKAAAVVNLTKWKIQAQSTMQLKVEPKALLKTTNKVIAIGASTGGTQAIETVIKSFPANAPGTVIVQHMPAGFTKAFSSRLNGLCQVEVKEAEDGDQIRLGRVLIAPGNKHMLIERKGAQYFVQVKDGPLVGHHRPSVDVLFQSVAVHVGTNAIGVILTGMGSDGSNGMLKMRQAGSLNFAQDEQSSVVYGMPRAAFENGSVNVVLPLHKIAEEVLKACN